MSYEPFALKYRPRVFADVVGQEAVAATLRNALQQDRVANAFLFAGSRGVGKTSMARILAKALNCTSGSDGEPCGTCEVCLSIASGEDIDVIEVDGASNRGIDEIRTIRDNVAYAPSRGRFKVYIIDEVHMLTVQAFNALLKTLEEPPPHVKFIFATTEPQAVLETIVSRCQRYEFRRISLDDIIGRLQWICEQEGITAGAEVLREIAIKGEGGLRDSLSLLDQLVAFCGNTLSVEALDRVLGRIDTQVLGDILEPLGVGESGAVLDALTNAFESGRDAEDILEQVTELLREAMSRTARGMEGGGEGRRAHLVASIRDHFDLDRLLLALRVCLNTRREIKLAGQGRLQLEVGLLKIARSKDLLPLRVLAESLRHGGGGGASHSGAGSAPSGGPAPSRPFRPYPGSTKRPSGSPRQASGAPEGPQASAGRASSPPPGPSPAEDPPSRTPSPSRTMPSPSSSMSAPPQETQVEGANRPAPPGGSEGTSFVSPSPDIPAPIAESPAPAGGSRQRTWKAQGDLGSRGKPVTPSGTAQPSMPVPSQKPATPAAATGAGFIPLEVLKAKWPAVVDYVKAERARAAPMVEAARPEKIDGNKLCLRLAGGSAFHVKQLEGPTLRTLIQAALDRTFGRSYELEYQIATAAEVAKQPAREKVYDDPGVRKLLDSFGGNVIDVRNREVSSPPAEEGMNDEGL